jgi:hypothetical protein
MLCPRRRQRCKSASARSSSIKNRNRGTWQTRDSFDLEHGLRGRDRRSSCGLLTRAGKACNKPTKPRRAVQTAEHIYREGLIACTTMRARSSSSRLPSRCSFAAAAIEDATAASVRRSSVGAPAISGAGPRTTGQAAECATFSRDAPAFLKRGTARAFGLTGSWAGTWGATTALEMLYVLGV